MRIGILCPFEDEIAPIIREITSAVVTRRAGLDFFEGLLFNVEVVAVMSGICKVNAAIAAGLLIDRFRVGELIVCGVAGAIGNLNICDTVVPYEIAYHDVEDGILTNHHPCVEGGFFRADKWTTEGILAASKDDPTVKTGRVVTGEAFITKSGREEIIKRFKPACVDMETAAAAHVAHVNNVPFAAIRSMSDNAEECGTESFEKYCKAAAEKSAAVLFRYLKSFYA